MASSQFSALNRKLHCFQRSNYLCWHDCPYSSSSPNQSRFPDWRSQKSFLICRKMNKLSNWRRCTTSLELLRCGYAHVCMELGMCGLGTCQLLSARSRSLPLLRLLLLKSFRTMLPTIIKYGGCILSWWTCGGHGSIILPEPEKLLISCGSLRIVRTRRVSPFRPDGFQPPLRCRRFAYGHAFDGSEFPCYLV